MSPGTPTTMLRLALAGLLASAPCALWAGEVTGISVNQGSTGTRAEIQLAGAGQYKTLSLQGPDRLVVDLPASKAKAGLRLPAPTGIVRAVRTGQPDADTLRIVFDLASPVAALKPRMEQVAGVSRLVIEWPGDGPAAPAPTPATPAQATPPQAVVATAAPSASPTAVPGSTQTDAARATALLTAQVVRAGTAPAPSAAAPTQGAMSPSPQAILNGQSTPIPVPATSSERPAYTIATGQPAPVVPGASAPAPSAAVAESSKPPAMAATGARPLVIAIDPGHGGQDPGAIGPSGRYEKHAVLAISKELARQINATPGMKAYLVRDNDVYVERPQRARKARAAKADMFVSIHADAAENRSAWGSSVYVLSLRGASSQHARWLADKENAADAVGGLNVRARDAQVQRALLDMSTTAQINDSLKLGGALLGEIGKVGKLHKPRVEQAGFAVLKAPDIPSVLVETAFISNPDEEARLKSEDYQEQLADALMQGIRRYFAANPPLARNRPV